MSADSSVEAQVLDDGSVAYLDTYGDLVLIVAPPWAYDANKQPLATWYELDGLTVVQKVDLTESGIVYPVVADPYLGMRLIGSVTRSYDSSKKAYRYAVDPTWWGRSTSSIARKMAWDEAKTYYSALNTPSLRDQFYCHWDARLTGTAFKGTWNLEAWRPHVSYATMLRKACNP